MTPYSAPTDPRTTEDSLNIEHGIAGAPCPPGGVPPFKPAVVAGTENNRGGSYSPFYLRIERQDGEQEITGFGTTLPPGLTGNLTGIPFCGEAQIQRAREQSGAEAQTNPACPAASEIGHSIAEAGVGSVLAQTPGRVYLGGPLEGAPFSIVSITSAKVGPFDLGTVVVHLPLLINPITAAVSIPAGAPDQIPHIIKGIVVHLRAIRVYIDRERFILNPTSCQPMSLSATVVGAGADFADPADADPVTGSDHFQAANCSSLAFKPTFRVFTQGKTSRKNGASLQVRLSYPQAPLGTQANIAKVHVELPKQLPSRLTTLQKACADAVFNANPANCPVASRIGTATATTPILPVAISGPAYFVSHGGAKFPELIIVLQGYGVTVDLDGETFINKAGITSTTFNTVPDVPVSTFQLTLPSGPDSVLAANGDLCAQKLVMPTTFTAQNEAKLEEKTPISVEGCKPQIRVLRHSVKGKHATVVVSAPSAGRLIADGGGVIRSSRVITKAATVTMTLRLSRSEQRFVAHHHGRRLEVPIKLSFTPAHGGQLSARVAVLLR